MTGTSLRRILLVSRGVSLRNLLLVCLSVSLRSLPLVCLGLSLAGVGAPVRGQQPVGVQARTALLEGRYDEALRAYGRLVRDDAPASVVREYVRGLLEVGRYDDAIEAATPERVDLANVRGEALLAVGRWDEAEDAFRRAVDGGASDRISATLNLGVLAWNRGERARAFEIFDSFIDIYNRASRLSAEELLAVGTAVKYLGKREWVLNEDALMAYDQAAEAGPGDPLPDLLAGELFLEKYNSTDAYPSFAAVLDRNASHPRALLGRARALDFDGQSGALEVVDQALETNPDYPDARAFKARLLLKTEDYDEARQEAERALATNPVHLESLSVLAAAHYFSGDRTAYQRVHDQVLRLNPVYPELYNTLAQLSVDQRRYQDAVDLAARAVALDSTSWTGWGIQGMNQLRVQQIAEGRESLTRAFEGDAYNPWFKNSLDLLDTFDRYETVRTEHFELFLRSDEADLVTPYVAELAEEAYAALTARYGVEPPLPIRLEMFPSHADFSVRTLGLAGLGALGVSFGSTLVMDSPSAHEPGEFNWASVFWHELSHAFHLAMTDHRVPRWFSEGLAVHEQRVARDRWGHQPTPLWLQAYRSERLHPVSRLNEGFVRPTFPEQVVLSYYQASLVFELIENRWGFDAVLAMLHGYREGKTTNQLIPEVLGQSVEDFDETFDDYVRENLGDQMAAVEPLMDEIVPGQMSLEELERRARRQPGSFQARLALGKALYDEGRMEEAEAELEAARELFPQYGAPDSPWLYLARIRRDRGDLEGAAAALHELGRRNENLYQVHVEEGEILLELGEQARAAGALQNAVEVFPYDIDLHSQLADLYEEGGELEGAVRERTAVLALDPVDKVVAHFRLAQVMARAGDRAGARTQVLRALELAPTYEPALELLLDLRGGGR